jgi:hypothetical protein
MSKLAMHFLFVTLVPAVLGAAVGTFEPATTGLKSRGDCPAVWQDVATDLHSLFVDGNGQATDDARAAIRLSFHDCFPGACDGSIILANECGTRPENSQMVSICGTLGSKATQYNVSTADTIQLATGRCLECGRDMAIILILLQHSASPRH